MGDTDADKAAAVAVMHSLYRKCDVCEEPIELWLHHTGRHYVTATRKVPSDTIMLPPVVHKQSRVHERS